MRKIVPAILLFCMLSPAPAAEKWTQVELWRHQLQKGMTDRDVIRILGRPKDKEATQRTMIMYFQEPIERINGQITHRPDCGVVRLRDNRARGSRLPVFQVYDWMEPNWELLQQIAEAKAAEIEAAKAEAAEAKLLRLEQASKAAELRQEEIRQQQLARKQRIEQERKTKQEAVTTTSVQQSSKEPRDFSFNIFIYAGAGLLVLALVGALLFNRPGG
jgi:hypothetical protein